RGHRIVAGDHHGLDAHAAQLGEALLDAPFDYVLEIDDAQSARSFGDDQRRTAALGDVIHGPAHLDRGLSSLLAHENVNCIGRSFANLPAVEVDAAEARLGGEGDEAGAQFVNVAPAQAILLLG